MFYVLSKAGAFVSIIALGYILKRAHFFELKDFYLLSKIVIRITLPCAIISNFSKISIDASLLVLSVIGLLCNVLLCGLGYLISLRHGREEKAFAIINTSGYNIGNFTLPFVQSFLGATGFAAASLFDTGNSVMCTGLTYSVALAVQGKNGKVSLKSMVKSLFSSLPFDAYLVMTVLMLCHVTLPTIVLSFAETVGNANPFIALLMIGIGFEIRLEKSKLARLAQILFVRYGTALLLSLAFYFLLPFGVEVRQALAIIAFGPVSSVATAYTGAIGGDVELSSAINSLSIVTSIVCITIVLMIIL